MKNIAIVILFLLAGITAKASEVKVVSFGLTINSGEPIDISAFALEDLTITAKTKCDSIENDQTTYKYRCRVEFPRGLNDDEKTTIKVFVSPKRNAESPLDYSTTYYVAGYKDLQQGNVAILLRRGVVKLPIKYKKGKNGVVRLVQMIESGNGYEGTEVSFVRPDASGDSYVRWEGTRGNSILKVIERHEFDAALRDKREPHWQEWEFDLDAEGDPVFVPK